MTTLEKNRYKYLTLTGRSKKYKLKWNGIPAFMKRYEPHNSLFNHLSLSIFHHIILLILFWVLFCVLKIGIINPIFKPVEKMKDIEFVISNSSSSGHTPKLGKSQPAPKTENMTNNGDDANFNPTTQHALNPVKTAAKNSFAHIPFASPDDFSIPMPAIKPASSGSGGQGRRAGSNSSGNSSYGINSADVGLEDGALSGSGSSKGSGFDKAATKKAITAYDISPYVNELKRNVRMNWKPSQNSEGKYVELFLRIAKDGRLIILNVKKTSEVGDVDEAALNAVRKTLPLSPLPSKYGKSFLDLIFTFNSSSSSVGSRY